MQQATSSARQFYWFFLSLVYSISLHKTNSKPSNYNILLLTKNNMLNRKDCVKKGIKSRLILLSKWQNIYRWWYFDNHWGERFGFLSDLLNSSLPCCHWEIYELTAALSVALRSHTCTHAIPEKNLKEGTGFLSLDPPAVELTSCSWVEPPAMHLIMNLLLRHDPRHWPSYTYLYVYILIIIHMINSPEDPKTAQQTLSFQQR